MVLDRKTIINISLIASVVLAIGILVTFRLFASSMDKGRVFSWRQGTVLEGYKVFTTNPDPAKFQHVVYTENGWDGQYMSIYTETSTPLVASRVLKLGDEGEDVLAIKRAIAYIGKQYTYVRNSTGGYNRVPISMICPQTLSPILDNKYDKAMEDSLTALGTRNISLSYKSYVSDGILDRYEQMRLLTLATDPGIIDANASTVYATTNNSFGYSGEIRAKAGATVNIVGLTGTSRKAGSLDPRYFKFLPLSVKNPNPVQTPKMAAFSQVALMDGALNPESLKAGTKSESALVLNRLLARSLKMHKVDGVRAQVPLTNSTYSKQTTEAVKAIQRYYGLPMTGLCDNLTLALLLKEVTWGVYN